MLGSFHLGSILSAVPGSWLPVYLSPLIRVLVADLGNQHFQVFEIEVCCVLTTAVEVREGLLSSTTCLTIVLVRFISLPSKQEQTPIVSCLTRMWFDHTCFKFLGLF